MENIDFIDEAIRRSLSKDMKESREATKVLLDIAVSELLNGTLSPKMQIWLGHRLSEVIDDSQDPRNVLAINGLRGRQPGCGSMRASDEDVSIMLEAIVLATGQDRGMSQVMLGDALNVDAETIIKVMTRARAGGSDYRGQDLQTLQCMLSPQLKPFLSDLITKLTRQ